jgi:hypothetical protein
VIHPMLDASVKTSVISGDQDHVSVWSKKKKPHLRLSVSQN